jgi:serine/threonine-protein kinase
MFAMPFDEERLVVTGGPVPVQQGIQQAAVNSTGAAQAAWSDSGSMAFVPGGITALERELVWVNRAGQQEPTTAPKRGFAGAAASVALSPDGTQAALSVLNATTGGVAGSDIWVWTTSRGALTRLTFTGAALSPVWTPDGRRICYSDTIEVFCQAADGSGQPLSLFKFPGLSQLRPFSPDGAQLLFTVSAPTTATALDIMIARLGPPVEIRPLIKTAFAEYFPVISPDGRWIAYVSSESGRPEVFVRPFPAVEQGRWQVSTDGGNDPRWSKNGRELFFVIGGSGAARSFWSSPIEPGVTFAAGKPTEIARGGSGNSSVAYDVAADGRFLVHVDASTGTAAGASGLRLVVVQNWFDELKARVPIPR